MLVNRNTYGYSNHKKYVSGRGFVDKMAQILTPALKGLKSVGSYITENRDLIAKPILGAIGTLGATALTASLPAIISHIAKRNKKHSVTEKLLNPDEMSEASKASQNVMPKYKEILENIMKTPSVNPVTNIIGSGLKSF